MSLAVWSWIFFGAFAVVLGGLSYYGFRKTDTAIAFSTAPRGYNPFVIGIAVTATSASAAALLGNPGLVYASGWPALWYAMGGYGAMALAWASSALILSRIGKNANAKSMADFMGIRFQSPLLRVVTALAAIFSIYYIAGQFSGLGLVFAESVGTKYLTGVIIGAIVMAIYISIGGSHTDIMSAFVQGLIMVVFAVVVTVVVLVKVGGIQTIDRILTSEDPSLSSSVVFQDPQFGPFTGIAIFVSLGLFALSPQMSKLWLALNDERNVTKALIWAFLGMSAMGLVMWLGGLGARVLYSDIAPDTSILVLISDTLPNWLTALLMVGVLSAILSTTAGLFLVVAVSLAVDIYRDTIVPMQKKKISPDKLDRRVLILQRILIPVLVIVGVLLAQDPPEFLTQLMWAGIGLFTGSVIPPMVIGSLWKGTTRRAAEIGSVAGFVTFIICTFVLGLGFGNAFFEVPWAGAGVATIISTVLTITVSFITKPLDKAYVAELFARS